MAQSKLQILLTVKDRASGALKKTSKQLSRMSKVTSIASKALGALPIAMGAVVAATVAMKKAFEFAEQGAQLKRLEAGAETLANTYGQSSDEIIDSIQRASGMTISHSEAMLRANQALLLGVARTPEQFDKLTKASIALGRAMGINAAQSMESVTVGIGRQSKLWLDNIGVIFDAEDAYKDYAKSIGKEVKKLTDFEKKQAFANEVLKAAVPLLDESGNLIDDEAAAYERLKAIMGDVIDLRKEEAAEGLEPVIDALADELGFRFQLFDARTQEIITMQEHIGWLNQIRDGTLEQSDALAIIRQRTDDHAQAMLDANSVMDGWRTKMLRGAEAAALLAEKEGEVADAIERQGVAVRELSEKEIGRTAIRELTEAFEDPESEISREDYQEAIGIIATTMLDMDEKTVNALFALQDIGDEFQETEDIYTFLGLIQAQADAWSNAEEAMRDYERALEGFGGGFDVPTFDGGDNDYIVPPVVTPPPGGGNIPQGPASISVMVTGNSFQGQVDFEEAVENAMRGLLQ